MREAAWEDRAMGAEYQPIENYGVIGNMRTAYHRKAARQKPSEHRQTACVRWTHQARATRIKVGS